MEEKRPRLSSPKPDIARVLRTAGSRPAHRESTTRVLEVPDGAEQRRRWLEQLSEALSEDKTLDVTPLLNRLAAPQERRGFPPAA